MDINSLIEEKLTRDEARKNYYFLLKFILISHWNLLKNMKIYNKI